MIDLTTGYLGLKLRTPLVASSSPLSKEIGNILRLEDSGASAIVLHSLFEEQITRESGVLDRFLTEGTESFGEALSYFPEMVSYNLGPEPYLNHLRKAKESCDVPIVASLNGVSTGGWIRYAQLMEQAGADALELNVYYLPTDLELAGEKVEEMYSDLVSHVKASVRIPVAVKVVPNLVLSDSSELRLRLHWAALLYNRIRPDIAITGGVHSATDVVKSVMAGARVAMLTSALLRHGPEYLAKLEEDLSDWMEEHEYESIQQMRGSMSSQAVSEPAAFERANYMKVLSSYTLKSTAR